MSDRYTFPVIAIAGIIGRPRAGFNVENG